MDLKDIVNEFAKGARKGVGPLKPEVALKIEFTDSVREDLEYILQKLDSTAKTVVSENVQTVLPELQRLSEKIEVRWKVTQYLLVVGFVINGAVALILN
jgi:hypothetical protein